MSATFGPQNLPYPQPSDAPDGPGALLNLIQAIQVGGFTPSPTYAGLVNGLFLGQHATVNADPTPALNGDYVWNGTVWHYSGVFLLPFTDGTTITAGGNHNTTINFPAGMFSVPPQISFGLSNSRFNASSSGVTTTTATVSLSNWSTAAGIPGACVAYCAQSL